MAWFKLQKGCDNDVKIILKNTEIHLQRKGDRQNIVPIPVEICKSI